MPFVQLGQAGENADRTEPERHRHAQDDRRGWLPNTDANLKMWLMHFDEVKPGVNMKLPAPLTDAEADALLAYLRTKR